MKHKRWSIYRANLDPVVGTEINKSRPVLIISNDAVNELLQNLTILPVSSRKQDRTIYPNETLLKRDESGLEVESIVLCHQIRTIDKQRLSKVYGFIEDQETRTAIERALSIHLGLSFIKG